jgi:hypothetical protein
VTDAGVTDGGAPSAPESSGRSSSSRGVGKGALVGGVIAALAVGVIVGGLIGWQVEKSRVQDDVKKAKSVARTQGAQNVRPVGVVTAVSPNSVTIRLRSTRGTKTFAVTNATKVDKGVSGTSGNVTKGAVVIVQPHVGETPPRAAEIIVLPTSTKIGQG